MKYISSASGLSDISQDDDILLTNNIDASDTDRDASSIKFRGTFDGNGYTISGLDTALFYTITHEGVIKNVNFSDITYNSTDSHLVAKKNAGVIKDITIKYTDIKSKENGYRYGLLVNTNNSPGVIKQCTSHATIQLPDFNRIGSLVGRTTGNIINCNSYSDIKGQNKVGGIVGSQSETSKIKNCSSMGEIVGENAVGGIVGSSESIKQFITQCSSTASITGEKTIGGIVGLKSYGKISSCSFDGEINANKFSGGICGNALNCDVKNCINTGQINSKNQSGGIIGKSQDLILTKCRNHGEVSGSIKCGGIVGSLEDCGIIRSSNHGEISGEEKIGGIAGQMISNESDTRLFAGCYTKDTVFSENEVGVLVGKIERTNFEINKLFWISSSKSTTHSSEIGCKTEVEPSELEVILRSKETIKRN